MWTVQHLLGIRSLMEFSSSCLHGRASAPGETWRGPQYQNQYLKCIYVQNVRVLCFGALFFSEALDILDGAWKSTCSFFIPTSFHHCLAPCSGCGQHCLQCYLILVCGQVGESLWSHWTRCHHKAHLSPPRAGPVCVQRALWLLWASHRFLPAGTACRVKA